jgi:hypothetical protein
MARWPDERGSDPAGQFAIVLSGWRDLNLRPLDLQIGPPRLSSVNHLSLVSMVDR